ncbi:g patch domain and ankyrin repeat-containing protein 1 [Trichonephila clavipes]|nr:g patch domain and ankyrin repeat-containing protein 1 [Trichonephila clavipes]
MEFSAFSQSQSLPVKMISFVSSSKENSKDHEKYKSTFEPNLSGTEVSNFYNSVISLPSEHQHVKKPSNYLKKKPDKSQKSGCCSVNNVKSNSIFLYAQQGNVVGIQQCIENGCSINQQDAYGWTPIMCASCEGHYSTVEYLIKLGANLNIKCKHGCTVMDIARKTQNSAIITLLQNGVSLHEQETSSVISDEEYDKEKFCNDCKSAYKVSLSAHERSIAHLLTTTKSDISTFYHIPENNKGFQMMLKSGWDKNKGLGINADGRKFPIKTVLKKDRSCIGKNKEVPKVTHFNANDEASIKMSHHKALRIIREKTLRKQERKKHEARDREQEIRFRRLFNT